MSPTTHPHPPRLGLAALIALAGVALATSGGCGASGAGGAATGDGTGAATGTTGTTGEETAGGSVGSPPAAAEDAGVAQPVGDAGSGAGDATADAGAGPAAPPPSPGADAGAAAAPMTMEAWQALVRRGRQRFDATCDTCHPGGDEDIGPRIIGKNFSIDRMRQQIRNGSGRMRPIPVRRLADEDLDALFAYLSTLRAVRGVERPR